MPLFNPFLTEFRKNNMYTKMILEHWWNDTGREKTEVLGGNTVTVPLCPSQNSHGLAWD
jgi:hypothetical protein